MLKSIAELLKYAPLGIGRDEFLGACCNVEREVAEKFTPLPIGADGKQLRPMDEVVSRKDLTRGTVQSIALTPSGWEVIVCGIAFMPSELQHFKLNSVDALLEDFGREYHEACKAEHAIDIRTIVRKYTAKICEAVSEE